MRLRRPEVRTETPDRLWADSGAMWLTGREDGPPLLAPPALPIGLARLAAGIAELSDVVVDGPSLLGERAAIAGLSRHGARSCGEATRLLRASDGWVAVSLPRADDVVAVPAWLDGSGPDEMPAAVAARRVSELTARATLLGLPVTAMGEAACVPAMQSTRLPGECRRATELSQLVVIDLSSLWAGPLCGQLLTAGGARVIKVESESRPDGARAGPAAFFDLLHAGQESVALDFASRAAIGQLTRLLQGADIVIEGSRPRALTQLGIDREGLLGSGRPRIWVSITGFGRAGDGANRVAFGDDAAVAGGLVVWDGDEPCFCADAVADPATGLLATNAVLSALAEGGRWLLDVALSGVAAELAGRHARERFDGRDDHAISVARPVTRRPRAAAPRLGEHTAAVLRERCR